jgi:hypothetical protein
METKGKLASDRVGEMLVRVLGGQVLATQPAGAPLQERSFRYSAETRLAMQRQGRAWLRSARPTDSDWEVTHGLPNERTR